MSRNNGHEISIAKEFGEVVALREDWQRITQWSLASQAQLRLDPSVNIDFYLTLTQDASEVLRPHVIVLKHGGMPEVILAGRIEKKPLQVAMGYKRLSSRPVRLLTLIHGGTLGEDSEEHASLLVDSVKASLKNHDADVALFYGMEMGSCFQRVVKAAGGCLSRDYFPAIMPRWRIQLPATYEELYQERSSNTRHNLKRYSKRLRDAFGDKLLVRSFRRPEDVETILSDTEAIAAKTYQRGLGVGFDRDAIRHRMMLTANQGWLRAHILYIGDRPAAYWNGILYHRTCFTWTTGYDPDLGELRPGMFLLQVMLRELCDEKGTDVVDFGFGDAQYKRDWCDCEHFQVSQFLFAPSLMGLSLNVFHTSLFGASNAARQLLARTGALQKVKKAWRRHMAEGAVALKR